MDSTASQFRGLRSLVVGLAREGTALAQFLTDRGASVTVTDRRPDSALQEALASLAGRPIRYALGGHPFEILEEADVVFVSPGVPKEIPLLLEAQRRGLPLSSETRLFAHLCPAPIVGITASSGKTTTTALTGRMMDAAGRTTWVGGNIGTPLLPHLTQIQASDWVVLELSSFQLEFLAPMPHASRPEGQRQPSAVFTPEGWSPAVAALLNITPNHLDRHSSMEAYVAAKLNIVTHQRMGDRLVVGWDNPESRRIGLAQHGVRRILWFSLSEPVEEGAYLHGDELVVRLGGGEGALCRTRDLQILGQHNVANVLAACALAGSTGVPLEAMRHAATTFRGVEHRLELVRERAGVRWYNDSIATTPERTVAALQAFEAPIVLLAGGRDKHLPWDTMAALTWKKARSLILFGEAAELIDSAMRACPTADPGACRILHAGTLERAVELAAEIARPGQVVLLSPGGTSFDAYQDFEHRGVHFRRLVAALE